MSRFVNAAIQILPASKSVHPYDIVDKAIEVIKASGLHYEVCPFETVVEGEYNVITKLIDDIHNACYIAGAESILCNVKIHSAKDKNVTIEDKMHKYRK